MTMPLAYEPEHGYQYQILCKSPYDRTWEHCDYAKDLQERKYLICEYSLAYGPGYSFKWISLPMKYWPKTKVECNYIVYNDEFKIVKKFVWYTECGLFLKSHPDYKWINITFPKHKEILKQLH